jgi:ABC-2 type transport system ATP-binding protein
MAVLEVHNLNKTFKGGLFEKDHVVLRNVSFQLPEGQTSGFVGSNGSGKTTTIKCLFNFIHPDSGNIEFFGQTLDSDVKTRIGYLPERPYLYEFLTGLEFLRLHWNLCYGLSKKDFYERACEALRKVDLYEAKDRRLRTYSKISKSGRVRMA